MPHYEVGTRVRARTDDSFNTYIGTIVDDQPNSDGHYAVHLDDMSNNPDDTYSFTADELEPIDTRWYTPPPLEPAPTETADIIDTIRPADHFTYSGYRFIAAIIRSHSTNSNSYRGNYALVDLNTDRIYPFSSAHIMTDRIRQLAADYNNDPHRAETDDFAHFLALNSTIVDVLTLAAPTGPT